MLAIKFIFSTFPTTLIFHFVIFNNFARGSTEEFGINIISVGCPEETFSPISHSIEAFERLNEHETFHFETTQYHFSTSVTCRVKDFEEECEPDDIKHPYELEFGMITTRIFSHSEVEKYPDLQLYPALAIGVVPIYNIPAFEDDGVDDIVLSPSVLAKIFRSEITHWNDSEILDLNPASAGLLPNATIKVCVRDDESGITEIFKGFLSEADTEFAMVVGSSSNTSWGSLSAEYRTGKKGVLSYITTVENSISYFPYDIEALDGTPKVTIQQPEHKIVISQETVQAAVHDLGTHFAGDENPEMDASNFFTAEIHSSDALGAWPIVGYAYFAMRRQISHEGADCEVVERSLQFFDWFYNAKSPSRLLQFLGFGYFPHLHVEDLTEHFWSSVYCHDELVEPGYHRELTVAGPSNFAGAFDWFEAVFYGKFGDEEIIDIYYDSTLGEGEGEGSAYQEFVDGIAHVIVSHRFGDGTHDQTNILELPFFAAQLSIIVNLCGDTSQDSCNSTVYMDAASLAGVFDGSITTWNDDRLVALNSFLSYYPYSIHPILDEESEEATQMFVEHMEDLVPGFELEHSFATENNMHHVEAFVYGTPYSIGVTFLNPDIEHLSHITFVHFVEDDGTVSYPTMDTHITECVRDGFDYSEHRLSFHSAPGLQDCHYPFITTYYLFAYKTYDDEHEGDNHCQYVPLLIAQFLEFLLKDDEEGALYHYDLLPLVPTVDYLYEYSQGRVDGMSCNDVSLLLGEVEHTHQNEALKEVAIGLASLSILFSCLALFWVVAHKKMRIVRFSQPLFLYIMLVGCIIYSATLIPLTFDEYYFPAHVDEFGRESYPVLDSTCQVIPWLYTTGFVLIFGSLLGKTWRIKEIFINPELKKKTIKNKTVLMQVGSGLSLAWLILIVWSVDSPLQWIKVKDKIDPVNGISALEWHGRCGSNRLVVYLPLILICQLAAFLYGTVLSYKIRSLKDDFSETTSINLAMFTNMQALFFVVLLGYIEQHNPTLLLLVETFFILLGGFGTTALIIIPKIWIVHFVTKIGVSKTSNFRTEKANCSKDPLASHTTSSNDPMHSKTRFEGGSTTYTQNYTSHLPVSSRQSLSTISNDSKRPKRREFDEENEHRFSKLLEQGIPEETNTNLLEQEAISKVETKKEEEKRDPSKLPELKGVKPASPLALDQENEEAFVKNLNAV